jgi:hypothetical protein
MKKSHVIKNGIRFPTWYELVMAQANAGNSAKANSGTKTSRQSRIISNFALV